MRPGEYVEDFTLSSFINDGPDEDFTLSDHRGKYVLLIFYPADFGYVTPDEFYLLEKILPTLISLNCEVVAISTEHIAR